MFNQNQIEEKWQQIWENNQLFQHSEQGIGVDGKAVMIHSGVASNSSETGSSDIDDNSGKTGKSIKDKMYLLFAFAYPSGSGLHVGHVESKTALDILARYYRMKGKDVFFPVGWDAFGLPAENYAIKTGVHPKITTKDAIDTFRRQIKRIGISYDWANELATNHPEYYKWTQWIFTQMFSKGLAYQKNGAVNWCPSCQTVLANEQVVEGRCERCDSEVVQKQMKQWYYKITQYQDELISGLDQVDWPEATKAQQLNWIGKSDGAQITFAVTGSEQKLEVYTTAHDTIYGCTFMVIAPEHEFLQANKQLIENWEEVAAYIESANKKTELERQTKKEKTGVLVKGITLTNPVNDTVIPLYVADYVLVGYGTGAIMAVPGHDERDFEFAQKYGIEVIPTAELKQKQEQTQSFISYSDIKEDRSAYVQINSDEFDGQDYAKSRIGILEKLEKAGKAEVKQQYRLRDWLISRQRYWGTPIPIVYDPEGNPHPVKQEHLPWELPTDVDFKPTGESPLKSSKEFIERTQNIAATAYKDLIAQKGWDESGRGWVPEFDTMDTFVDSSWYFLRYVDSRNSEVFAQPEQVKAWLPVDLYMIGPEHIVLHLLYSRFFTKFLRDEGYLQFDEPFMKMRHQGMILGPDNRKMSKSKGNVINPDEIIEKFGADTLRVYEMFMGPLEADKPWDVRAVIGVYKFLQRVYSLVSEAELAEFSQEEKVVVEQKLHQLIAKATDDIPKLKFNTSIAFMMEFLNLWQDQVKKYNKTLSVDDKIKFIQVLAPFAPFMADELYELCTGTASDNTEYSGVHISRWPEFDSAKVMSQNITIPVQINGKVRAQLAVEAEMVADEAYVLEQAMAMPELAKYLEDAAIKKKIYISGKIISLVV